MRIELNAGGLVGENILAFNDNFLKLEKSIDSVISSFKQVTQEMYNLNGGVGVLSSALDDIQARISSERRKKNELSKVAQKTNDFLTSTIRIDKDVARKIDERKQQLYDKFPHLQPPPPPKELSTGEKLLNGVKKLGGYIKDKAKKFVEDTKVFINNAKDKLVDWYENCGGKEIINIAITVAKLAVAVTATVTTILALPASGFAVAVLIVSTGALIATSVNSGVDVGAEIIAIDKKKQAREAEKNGDYERAKILREEAKNLSDTNTFQQYAWNDGETNADDYIALTLAIPYILKSFVSYEPKIVDGTLDTIDMINTLQSSDFGKDKHINIFDEKTTKAIGDTVSIGKLINTSFGVGKDFIKDIINIFKKKDVLESNDDAIGNLLDLIDFGANDINELDISNIYKTFVPIPL